MHPSRLLATFGGRARKRFGQNFLASPSVVARIVAAAVDQPGVAVLEVGPGLGVLTGGLLAAGAQVTAVEIDRDLVAFLRERFGGEDALHLVEGDASEIDWSTLLPGSDWVCAANLPYNVGTGLVIEMLRHPDRFRRLVVMLQEEVAKRILALPGQRHRGSLSVYCQARATVSRVVRVPPGAFHPPPKVKSAVIRLDLHPVQPEYSGRWEAMEKVVRTGFSAPRKMVRKSLASGFGKEQALAALMAAGVDGRARPADLTNEQWWAITGSLEPA